MRPKRQPKQKREKQYDGKKCPFCYTHLRYSEVLDDVTGIIHESLDCPDCGRYSRTLGD